MTRRSDSAKRALDIGVTVLAMPLLIPLSAVIAALTWRKLGHPVLFKQERPGLNAEPFTMLKFRTMREPTHELRTNEDRMTDFGKLLRSTSMDELPSFINIVRGEMSLVGPRPLRMAYIPRYSRRHARRHEVRPGLTGLAQVQGRNTLDWNRKLDLDVEYVERRSLAFDLQILLRTLKTVLVREGISTPGQATADEFMGSGISLRTRELMEDDLATRVAWLQDPEVRAGISIDFWPDIDGMQSWFERTISDDTRRDYVCIDEYSNPASMFGFTNINGSAATIYVFADPDRLNQGIGRNTMVQLLKVAGENNFTNLSLETKTTNDRAFRLYERFGFTALDTSPVTEKVTMIKKLGTASAVANLHS